MALGIKTGGRRAGTPNRRTVELSDRLTELGVDPVAQLAQIALDDDAAAELRARVACELLAYLYPKRRALDVNAGSQQPVSIHIGIPVKAVAPAVPGGQPVERMPVLR